MTLLAALISVPLTAQKYVYDVVWKGDVVGVLHVVAQDSADCNIFSIDSEVNIWFFGNKNIVGMYRSVYQNGELARANTSNYRNGALKQCSSLNTSIDRFAYVDGKRSDEELPLPIVNSVASLYHVEPKGISGIFSERFGQLLSIHSPEPNTYIIKKPDGKHTHYYFEDGVCQKVVVDNFLTSFSFILKEVH